MSVHVCFLECKSIFGQHFVLWPQATDIPKLPSLTAVAYQIRGVSIMIYG